MTDRELLELAAKAAGHELLWLDERGPNGAQPYHADSAKGGSWNPLADDGDALRLAVKLSLHVQMDFNDPTLECVFVFGEWYPPAGATEPADAIKEPAGDDPYAATRRAIVRAAAEVGKGMEGRQ